MSTCGVLMATHNMRILCDMNKGYMLDIEQCVWVCVCVWVHQLNVCVCDNIEEIYVSVYT